MYTWAEGQTDVSTYWRAYDTATGADYSGAEIAHNATGLTLAYARYKTAAVSAVTGGGTAPVDLVNAGSIHTDWGWCNVIGPFYRADFPDAAFTTGVPFTIFGVYGVSGVTFVPVTLADITEGDPRAAASTTAEVADALLDRNVAGGADGGRTVGQALASLRNRVVIAGGTLTVYDVDDITVLWTSAVTGTPSVTESNPA